MEQLLKQLETISASVLQDQLMSTAWKIQAYLKSETEPTTVLSGGRDISKINRILRDCSPPSLRASHIRNLRFGYLEATRSDSNRNISTGSDTVLLAFDDALDAETRIEGWLLVSEATLSDSFHRRDRLLRTLSQLMTCSIQASKQASDTAGLLTLLGSLRPNAIIVQDDGEEVVVPSTRARKAVFEALSAQSETHGKKVISKLVKNAMRHLRSTKGEWNDSTYYCEDLSQTGKPQPVFVLPLSQGANETNRRLFGLVVPGRVQPMTSGAIRRIYKVTPAEAKVVRFALLGKRPNQIAETMQISTETVRTYLSRIYQKLDVRGRSELIVAVSEAALLLGETRSSAPASNVFDLFSSSENFDSSLQEQRKLI